MDDDDRLRLEYDQAAQVLRGLTETRFRLLALVPTIAGAAVSVAPAQAPAVELLAIGLLGLVATLGILLYELRNGQIAAAVGGRVRGLEQQLLPGGPLVAAGTGRLFGVVRISHVRALALVYGAALAAWGYLVAWGALHAASVDHARAIGLALGAAAGVAAFVEVVRLEGGRAQ